jgi:hypothetical protein
MSASAIAAPRSASILGNQSMVKLMTAGGGSWSAFRIDWLVVSFIASAADLVDLHVHNSSDDAGEPGASVLADLRRLLVVNMHGGECGFECEIRSTAKLSRPHAEPLDEVQVDYSIVSCIAVST